MGEIVIAEGGEQKPDPLGTFGLIEKANLPTRRNGA